MFLLAFTQRLFFPSSNAQRDRMETPEGKANPAAAAPPAQGCRETEESAEQEKSPAPSSEPSGCGAQFEDEEDQDESSSRETPTTSPTPPPPQPPPPPPPPHCYGMRAYDGGYFDVGSFFVLHPHEDASASDASGGGGGAPASAAAAASSQSTSESPAVKDGRSGDPPLTRKREIAAAKKQQPSPLGFEFLYGLKIKTSKGKLTDKEMEGQGSEGAMRAFVELERQVGMVCVFLFIFFIIFCFLFFFFFHKKNVFYPSRVCLCALSTLNPDTTRQRRHDRQARLTGSQNVHKQTCCTTYCCCFLSLFLCEGDKIK